MSHIDQRTLINQGRKAGLTTAELYRAMSSRPPTGSDSNGRSDSNGYVSAVDAHGHVVYRPVNSAS